MACIYRCLYTKRLCLDEQHLPQNDICILLFMYRSNLHRVCISHPIQNLDWRQSRHPLCLDLLYRPIYHYPLLGFTASHAYQRGSVKLQTYVVLIGLVLHIPLSLFLGHFVGILGVILSMCIINLIYSTFFTIQIRKILSQKATGIWIK